MIKAADASNLFFAVSKLVIDPSASEKRTDDDCQSYTEEAKKLCDTTKFDLSLEFGPRRRPTRIPRKLTGDVLVSEYIGDSRRSKSDVERIHSCELRSTTRQLS